MITRIVKLSFESGQEEVFLDAFGQHSLQMQEVAGHMSLQLLRDELDPHIFFTISLWRDTNYLDDYRNSELFKSIWAKIKPWFRDRPQAWTTQMIYDGKN